MGHNFPRCLGAVQSLEFYQSWESFHQAPSEMMLPRPKVFLNRWIVELSDPLGASWQGALQPRLEKASASRRNACVGCAGIGNKSQLSTGSNTARIQQNQQKNNKKRKRTRRQKLSSRHFTTKTLKTCSSTYSAQGGIIKKVMKYPE